MVSAVIVVVVLLYLLGKYGNNPTEEEISSYVSMRMMFKLYFGFYPNPAHFDEESTTDRLNEVFGRLDALRSRCFEAPLVDNELALLEVSHTVDRHNHAYLLAQYFGYLTK